MGLPLPGAAVASSSVQEDGVVVPATPTIETERLVLTPYEAADADELFALYGDAETLRYWHRVPVESVEALRVQLDAQAEDEGEYAWSIRESVDGAAIGRVDFSRRPLGLCHVGYILRKERWGEGLVLEASRAMLDWAFRSGLMERAELWIYRGNDRSIRVAEKLGCRYRGVFTSGSLETGVHETMVFGVTAAEWGVSEPPEGPVPITMCEPVVTVADVDATIEWYSSRLGFAVDWSVGDPSLAASVSRGRWHERAILRFVTGPPGVAINGVSLVFNVPEELDRLFDEYRAAGVEVVQEPIDRPWGMREFAIEDPNGLTLRFARATAEPPDLDGVA
jgi:RimJ/RimL family protein N-acetyltransferase/catechol 2,3-dioxygenase-like lactoylglutathione lyase family enzyme